ncbi:MAG: hypothetical protein FWE85_02260 [Clostridiales bacterium]|nr:hypothetical protein [Clostridiales bacterium]
MAQRENSSRVQPGRSQKQIPYLPLIAVGLLIFLVISFLGSLVWGLVVYHFAPETSIEEARFVPLMIHFIALFAACLAISIASRGASPLPGLIVVVLISLYSLFQGGLGDIRWWLFFLKTGLGLLLAMGAFMLTVLREGNGKSDYQRPHSLRF